MEQGPPKPPKVARTPKLATWRWIGLAIMAGVPVAAAAGAFGETQSAAFVEEGPLGVEVEWPERAHFDTPHTLAIVVENRSAAPLGDVRVRLDPAWADNFGQIDFEPEPEAAWVFPLPPLAPGEAARVVGELRPKRAGDHRGFVEVRAGGATATVPLTTFVWP